MSSDYASPIAKKYPYIKGGLPKQNMLNTGRAIFKTAYAVIPKGVMSDIVTSYLPYWKGMRAWILARPMSGFSETFSHYVVELETDGGSNRPDDLSDVEAVIFVSAGEIVIDIESKQYALDEGGYAYIPPNVKWSIKNVNRVKAQFHWIRKRYQYVDGISAPPHFISHDDIVPEVMPDTQGVWATTRFVEPQDLRHDMHVNIVTFQPGGVIPFEETHVMEHGIYILQGKAVYQLNQDWVEVEAGDFIWLRAFCPQSCYAGGPEPFRYLLYKDVNRHAEFIRR